MPNSEVVLSVRLTRGEKVRFRAHCRRHNVTMSRWLHDRITIVLKMDGRQKTKPARPSGVV